MRVLVMGKEYESRREECVGQEKGFKDISVVFYREFFQSKWLFKTYIQKMRFLEIYRILVNNIYYKKKILDFKIYFGGKILFNIFRFCLSFLIFYIIRERYYKYSVNGILNFFILEIM